MNALSPLRLSVAQLTTEASAEKVAEVLGEVEFVARQLKELRANLDAALLEWVTTNGELVIGDQKFYAGTKSVTKCTDQRAALEAIINATAGDLDAIAAVLASGAFKYGTARSLGEEVARFFETTTVPDLKTGLPVREVKTINLKYAGRDAA